MSSLQYRLGTHVERESPAHIVVEWGIWHDSPGGDMFQALASDSWDALQVRVAPEPEEQVTRVAFGFV